MATARDELDDLLAALLRTLEAYLQVREELSSVSKQAFLSLARARQHLGLGAPRPALSNAPLHPQAAVAITAADGADGGPYTFTASAVEPPRPDEDELAGTLPRSAYADPIRLMAGLPPPSLRDAQRYFRDAALEALNLASLESELRTLEGRIASARKAVADAVK